MKAKEKAEELIEMFSDIVDPEMNYNHGRDCALACVNEILEATKTRIARNYFFRSCETMFVESYSPFWKLVKEEIEKL